MRFIKGLQNRVAKFVRQKGGTLPKIFVWLYAFAFLACGFITIFGIVYEFIIKSIVNYKAVNDFIRAYFAPSICGTFALLGVLLIDRNNDGIPDKWEEEAEEKEGENHGKNVPRV
jgi:hypothetical protein